MRKREIVSNRNQSINIYFFFYLIPLGKNILIPLGLFRTFKRPYRESHFSFILYTLFITFIPSSSFCIHWFSSTSPFDIYCRSQKLCIPLLLSFTYITILSIFFKGKKYRLQQITRDITKLFSITRAFLTHKRDSSIFANQKTGHTISANHRGDYKAFVSYCKINHRSQSQCEYGSSNVLLRFRYC